MSELFRSGRSQVNLALPTALLKRIDVARRRVRKQASWGSRWDKGPVLPQSRSEFIRDAIRRALADIDANRYEPPDAEERTGETPIVEVRTRKKRST